MLNHKSSKWCRVRHSQKTYTCLRRLREKNKIQRRYWQRHDTEEEKVEPTLQSGSLHRWWGPDESSWSIKSTQQTLWNEVRSNSTKEGLNDNSCPLSLAWVCSSPRAWYYPEWNSIKWLLDCWWLHCRLQSNVQVYILSKVERQKMASLPEDRPNLHLPSCSALLTVVFVGHVM